MIMRQRRKTTDVVDNSSGMWVSTNKVLIGTVGGLKRPHARNPNFDSEETKLLISLWGDPQVQKTLITTHKKHPVIAKLAEKMREYGYNRSTEEINTRIKNLKCFYNRIKKDLEAGTISETSWKHYNAMDEILSRPIFGNAHRQHMLQQQQKQQQEQDLQKQISQEQEQLNMQRLPVKLEVMSDDESREIRAEDLLKIGTVDQIDIEDAMVPKDEPMEDDLNDPDFEGDDDDDSDSDDSDDDDDDGSDIDIDNDFDDGLSLALPQIMTTSTAAPSSVGGSTVTTAVTSPVSESSGLKIMNYSGRSNLNITSVVSNATTSTGTVTVFSTAPTNTTTSTAPSKISLVPTNFLLKPQSQNLSFKSPIQLYTKPTVSMPVTTATVTSTASNMQQMKVLLVNTLPKDGTPQKSQILQTPPTAQKQIYNTSTTATVKPTIPTPIPIQPKPVITSTTGLMNGNITAKKPEMLPNKTSGFKVLLNQLVSLQRENLAVARSRLAIEKERMSFERQVGGQLVDILAKMNENMTKLNAQKKTKASEAKTSTTQSTVCLPLPSRDSIKAEVISDTEDN